MTIPERPPVSVCVVTYNQQKYIAHCLQSIVDQQTDFDFEVVVGDDCSTDSTREIIADFVRRYPRKVRGLLHASKVGAIPNYYLTYAAATGELIAHMDGDDLMLPGKLQKQHDFMRAHPECAFVAHKMFLLSEDGATRMGITPSDDRPTLSTLGALVESYLFFSHSSKMFRRSAHVALPVESIPENTIDFIWHVEHASTGDIGFINEVLGEYRKGAIGSLTSVKSGDRLHWLIRSTLRGYDRALELGVDARQVSRGRSKYLFGAAIHCASLRDYRGMLEYLRQCAACPVKQGLLPRLAGPLVRVPILAGPVLEALLALRNFKHQASHRGRGA